MGGNYDIIFMIFLLAIFTCIIACYNIESKKAETKKQEEEIKKQEEEKKKQEEERKKEEELQCMFNTENVIWRAYYDAKYEFESKMHELKQNSNYDSDYEPSIVEEEEEDFDSDFDSDSESDFDY